MKRFFYIYLMLAVACCSTFISCSDDDDNNASVTYPTETVVFADNSGLTLTYGGQPVVGKQVKLTPNAGDSKKATLEVSGINFNHSAMGAEIAFPTCGIVPGEVTTTLPVVFSNGKNGLTFNETVENNGVKIAYNGVLGEKELSLNVVVTMPENPLAGKSIAFYRDETGTDKMLPLIMKWMVLDPNYGFENDFGQMFGMALSQVKIGELSIQEFLYAVLNKISFLPDGNIVAEFKKQPNDSKFETSPMNIATYQYVSEGKIKVFLNPYMIKKLADEAKQSRQADNMFAAIAEVIKGMNEELVKLMPNGIPVSYSEENGAVSFYLDKDTVLPLFAKVLPLTSNAEFQDMVAELVEKKMPGMGATVKALMGGLGNMVENTTSVQLGAKFVYCK